MAMVPQASNDIQLVIRILFIRKALIHVSATTKVMVRNMEGTAVAYKTYIVVRNGTEEGKHKGQRTSKVGI